jgi:predicted GIY-YIG superfamily endonuclease
MKRKKCHSKSPAELQNDLLDIENKLKRPVNRKSMQKIFQRLEVAQDDCSSMKNKYTLFTEEIASGFEGRIRSLFGAVVTTHVNTEVDQILKEAMSLNPKNTKAVKALKKKIKDLKSWHRPSKENLIKIAKAESRITEDKCAASLGEEEIDPEEAQNLLQIASLVYCKKLKDRNKLYLSLSDTAKERFQKHLICLKTKAFEKETSTIQALFASAFDMAGIPSKYPSYSEIKDFFSEESNTG